MQCLGQWLCYSCNHFKYFLMGRWPLAMLSTAGMCASCLVMGFSFLLQDFNVGKEVTPVAVFIGLLIYPINVKGLAGSFVILVCSFCALITVYLFPFALD